MHAPTLPKPHLVQAPKDLVVLAKRLESQPQVAVDTESNSLYAYREQVCLIQFSTPAEDVLVDPISVGDLSPLAKMFAKPSIEKVLHAAEYDVMCLKRDFGFTFANLFDTYHAARILGWPRPGLGNILEDTFGIKLDKRYQRANWGRRPLEPGMLDYARLDTHYLLPLRQRMAEELRSGGHWQEAEELFNLLNDTPSAHNGFDPEGYWSIGHVRRLRGHQPAILRELYLWREDQAARQDRPPFKIMGDSELLAIAEAEPKSAANLRAIRGLSPRQVSRYGQALLEAVARGRTAPRPRRTATARTDPAVRERFEALRAWRKETAQARGVDSDVILPREFLWEIAREHPKTKAALKHILVRLPWRCETYGPAILKVLNP